MRKVICLIIALVLCVSMAVSAFAVEGEFVPSITYKDAPFVVSAEINGEDVCDCLVITTITQAKNKSTDITQEERDLLLEVYGKLSDGSMTLPMDDDYVIRVLVDKSFKYEACRLKSEHGDKPVQLEPDDVTLTVVFNLGIGPYTELEVFVYENGAWNPIRSVKNNGDGTVTCEFDGDCPVAFAVNQSSYETTPQTGDPFGQNLWIWIAVMAAAAVALVAVVVIARKKKK